MRADAGGNTCRKASSFASLAALLTPMAWKGAELFEEYIIIVIESEARGKLDQKAVQRLLFLSNLPSHRDTKDRSSRDVRSVIDCSSTFPLQDMCLSSL